MKVQQLTRLIFADCRHHTLPVMKPLEDESCSGGTMAKTGNAFVSDVVMCFVKNHKSVT